MFKVEEPPNMAVTMFSQQIDEDGDLLLLANDVQWGYVEASSGKLVRFFVGEGARAKLPELSFDQDGRLAIAS